MKSSVQSNSNCIWAKFC